MNGKRLNNDRWFSKHQFKWGEFCVNYRGVGLGETHVKFGMGQRCCLFDGRIVLAIRGIFLDRGGSYTGIRLF